MIKNNMPIKVGMLLSYDYEFVENSLPLLYPYADYIALAVDKDRKTWSGELFEIPDSFFTWLKKFDTDNKIHIYEDSFHVPSLKAIECDTRERNMLAKFMGEGGWHLQIDSDEYFIDFEKFIKYLKTLDISTPTLVHARWMTMFKKINHNYFLIRTNERFPVATNNPHYSIVRHSECQTNIYTDFEVLHQSWARDENEIKQKLRNWGHNVDFDVDSYYQLWKTINRQTYKYIKSFHPLDPWLWPSLEYFEAKNIKELTEIVNSFIKETDYKKLEAEKIKLRDFIPTALYKIKSRFVK